MCLSATYYFIGVVGVCAMALLLKEETRDIVVLPAFVLGVFTAFCFHQAWLHYPDLSELEVDKTRVPILEKDLSGEPYIGHEIRVDTFFTIDLNANISLDSITLPHVIRIREYLERTRSKNTIVPLF